MFIHAVCIEISVLQTEIEIVLVDRCEEETEIKLIKSYVGTENCYEGIVYVFWDNFLFKFFTIESQMVKERWKRRIKKERLISRCWFWIIIVRKWL